MITSIVCSFNLQKYLLLSFFRWCFALDDVLLSPSRALLKVIHGNLAWWLMVGERGGIKHGSCFNQITTVLIKSLLHLSNHMAIYHSVFQFHLQFNCSICILSPLFFYQIIHVTLVTLSSYGFSVFYEQQSCYFRSSDDELFRFFASFIELLHDMIIYLMVLKTYIFFTILNIRGWRFCFYEYRKSPTLDCTSVYFIVRFFFFF